MIDEGMNSPRGPAASPTSAPAHSMTIDTVTAEQPVLARSVKEADLAEQYRRRGTPEWKRYGSAMEHHRYTQSVETKSRRRCRCGCKRRATHLGMANGVCLVTGCELWLARWVRDPLAALRVRAILIEKGAAA